jgi:tape measure domain-containing protein
MPVTIPIGGDLAPLNASLNRLRTTLLQVSAEIKGAFAGISNAGAAASQKTDGSLKTVIGRLKSFGASAGTAGHALNGMVVGAQSLKTIAGALHLGRLTGSLRSIITSGGGVRGVLTAVAGRLRALVASPTFQKIAVSALAAAAAVTAVVIAVKVVKTGFGALQGLASRAFSAVRAGARGAASAVSGVASGIGSLPGKLGGLTGGLSPLMGVAAAMAGVYMGVSQLKSALASAGDFEELTVRVEQFTGSAEKAKALLEDMSKFALSTPFETKDVQAAAGTLLAAGIKENVGGLVKEMAAVSRNGQQLAELSEALGKGFAKGKFQTEEVNKFLERGINLMPELAAVTGKTGSELRKAIEEGLSFEQVTQAVRALSGEGGQFQGMLLRLSMTGKGLMSTLVSAWEEVRRAFGQPILDALKPYMQEGIKFITSLREQAAAAGAAVGTALLTIMAAFKAGQVWELAKAGLSVAFQTGIDLLMRGLVGAVAFLATVLPPIFSAAIAKLKDPVFWEGVGTLFEGVAHKLRAVIGEIIEPLVDATTVGGDEERAKDRTYHSIVGDVDMVNAKAMMAEAGGGLDFGKVMADALFNGIDKAAAAAGSYKSAPALAEARGNMQELRDSLAQTVAQIKDAAAVPAPVGKAEGGGIITPEMGGKNGQAASVISSSARIGKGGFGQMFFAPLVVEAKRQTGQLKTIASNTANLGNRTPAAYA